MRHDLTAIPDVVEVRAGRSRLLSRLYRDIGLAAVAAEFELPAEEFDPQPRSSDRPRGGVARGGRAAGEKLTEN